MGTQAYTTGAAHELPASMVGEITELPSINPAESSPEPTKSITRLRDLKTSARDQLMMDPRILVVDDKHNPRDYTRAENHDHLEEIKRSIKANTIDGKFGILQPLLIRFDPVRKAAVVVDGECRLRATLELIAEGMEVDSIPTIQVSGDKEEDRLLVAIVANTGKSLSKWELGTAFQRFHNLGWSPEKVAYRTGYNERFISEAMELADAPDDVKEMLSSQAVTPSLALAELRANGAAAVENLKAAAGAAKASGKKGPAKRGKAPAKPQKAAPAPAPAPVKSSGPDIPIGLKMAIMSLMEDVSAEDLNSQEKDAETVVKVSKLLKLASFAITQADLEAVGAKVA